MKLIVPLDNHGGMAFAHRRQSQDVRLRDYILTLCAGAPLFMNAYSAKQFAAHHAPNLMVTEDCLAAAGNGFCFVETLPVAAYIEDITTLILCRWNRDYPRDVTLDLDLAADWVRYSSTEIAGYSHEKITIEEWRKRS